MKKLWNFLRSMRFGMILLVVTLAISFVGSIIPQGNEAMWYVQNYPTAGSSSLERIISSPPATLWD